MTQAARVPHARTRIPEEPEARRRWLRTRSAYLYRFAKHTPDLPDYVQRDVRKAARMAAILARTGG